MKVALEVMGNSLSTAPDLVEMLERNFDGRRHRHLHGRRPRAHARATRPRPSRRRRSIWSRRTSTTTGGSSDDHLVPFQGSINWAAAIMAFEKIGYDGVLMYEVKAAESPRAVLERAVAARRRLEALMADSSD